MLGLPNMVVPQRRRGTNLPKMGDFNQAVILDSIRRSADLGPGEAAHHFAVEPQRHVRDRASH